MTEEWKPTKKENPTFKCRKCGSHEVFYRIKESYDGAHDDLNYKCDGCGRNWWVDGSDY